MGAGIVYAIQNLIYAPFAGGYESGLLKLGFVDVEGVKPSGDIINFIVFSFYALDIILAVVAIVLLPFVDIEKKMNSINEQIISRQKALCLANGKEWVDPSVLQQQEEEKYEKEREENRILDLKEYCAKKGLDFDKENQKYLNKEKIKEEKRRKKEEKKKKRNN